MSDYGPYSRSTHMAAMGGRLHRPLVSGEERWAVGLSQAEAQRIREAA